jgi:hypothetical protein
MDQRRVQAVPHSEEDQLMEIVLSYPTATPGAVVVVPALISPEDRARAKGILSDLADEAKAVVAKFAEAKSDANKLHKKIVAEENAELAPIEQGKALVVAAIDDYDARQKRIADARAAEEAAARNRALLDEAEARARAKRLEADDARAMGSDVEAAILDERAAATEDMALMIVEAEPAAPSYTPPTDRRETRSAEVFDIAALCRYIGNASPELLAIVGDLVKPNQAALNALVRAQGDRFNIPGVRALVTSKVNAGRR